MSAHQRVDGPTRQSGNTPIRTVGSAAASLIRRSPVWLLLIIIVAAFSIATPNFLTAFNLANVCLQAALLGFLAIGLTPVMINGNIDLSVGAIAGLSACLAVGLQPLGTIPAIAVALGAGMFLGALNGWIVEKAGISSFIVTLAAMIGVRGLAFLYAGPGVIRAVDDRFTDLGSAKIGPFAVVTILFVVLFVCLNWVLSQTSHGRNVYAVGGNRGAAVNAGLPVTRHTIINFAISGVLASVCGIALAAQLGAASATYGTNYELWAITAVVLGGTRLRGGSGTLMGTLGALLAVASVRNGIDLVNIPPLYVQVTMGLILILAIAFDARVRRR